MSQLQLLPAGAPELVRSNQKDRFYVDRITTLLSDITRHVLPLRTWLKWQRELQLLAELGYYSLTTLLDNQTLGEEYTNTIQVKSQVSAQTLYSPASFLQRTLAILLQTLGPYVIERALEVLYRRIRERSLGPNFTEQQYQALEKTVEVLEELVSTFNRLHLALFYMRGVFYHFGKRFAGIQYVMVRYKSATQTDVNAPMSTYRILGWIVLFQVMFKALRWLWDYLRSRKTQSTHSKLNHTQEATEESVSASLKCPLCLEMCRAETTTLCGHVFCWDCVCEWVSENTECPVCRCSVEPQQLVRLQHFEC